MNKKSITPFIDALFLFLLVFITITFLIKSTKSSDASVQLSEIYNIVMTWENESAADFDLWAKDSTDNIVGFNRREGGQGSLFALKRDDLGKRTETKQDGTTILLNEEVVSLRGTKEGEYIVNGHFYNKPNDEPGPFTVKCKLVKIKPFKEIIIKERIFNTSGDEETFFRFKFDKNGEVVETNELPAKIAVINSGETAAENTEQ